MHSINKVAFLDCSSGISGDMFLGVLVDAGVPLSHLEKELRKIPVRGYHLVSRKVKRAGLAAMKVDVLLKRKKSESAPRFEDIKKIISSSRLPERLVKQGISLYHDLFAAEGRVHGKRTQNVHLHELGGTDSIVDIMGALIGLDYLKIDKVYSSPVNVGSGSIMSEHGQLPVPAPATLELLKGRHVYSKGPEFEMTTPTGALIVARLTAPSSHFHPMKVTKTGYGAGTKNLSEWPNVLRIVLGEAESQRYYEEILLAETNIDDMNPQYYDYIMNRLFEAGALDVFLTQIHMKKNRPGTKLSVLLEKGLLQEVVSIIMDETTSLGVRFIGYGRISVKRRMGTFKTRYGPIRIKKVMSEDGKYDLYPEYDDCAIIAKKKGLPLKTVRERIIQDIQNGLEKG